MAPTLTFEQLTLLPVGDPQWVPSYQPPPPAFDADTDQWGDWKPE